MGFMDNVVDCLIVGAGPAGLTAAIYLARFRLTVAVIDSGKSRAALIPCTRNHAGFPEGIAGRELLARMRRQALHYGVTVQAGHVAALHRRGELFEADGAGARTPARVVLLATGVTNRRPEMPDSIHDAALAEGRLRYCPVCDGFEVSDQRVAVIGTGTRGIKEAEFMRSYTRDVTLVINGGPHCLTEKERRRIAALGILTIDGSPSGFALTEQGLGFATAAGWMDFDSVYPALGSDIHSSLAATLGADCTDEGCIRVDAHQRTSVTGLYAAGDVVLGLDQISHAMGEAGVAATTIRNDLSARSPLLR
jgi:thioredoxin reductase (NADPH)